MKLLIRDFPDDLHKKLKVMAAQKTVALYRLIIELIRKGMEG
jgi:plasmid stability protein